MPATTVGSFFLDEYLRDPSFYGQKQLWNPATEDPYTDPAVRQRIYNQLKASGQLQPSFDAMTGPESSWTAAGTDYNSALNIPDAPDRDQSLFAELAPIIGPFAGAIGGAGWLSNFLGAGSSLGGLGGSGGLEALSAFEAPWAGGGASGAAGAAGGGGLSDFFYGDFTGEAWIDDMLGNLSGNGFGSTTADPSTWLSGITGDASWMQPNGLQKLFMDMGVDPSKLAGNAGGSLLRSLFSGAGGANSGSYSFPFADVLKGLMEYGGQKDYQSELLRLMDKSIEYSDPFRTQRPRYFEPLYDAATKGVGGTPYGESIANSTLRKLSSTGDAGYDISGLGANTLAKNLNSASMDYVKNIAPLAGAQFGGNASQSITSMGPAAAGAGLAAQGGLGAAFEAANRGNQPSALEQLFGQQKNQNLGQALFSF